MKLYPPIIEGTIPAFSGSELIVPFVMNRSVSEGQVAGFALKLKTVQSNNLIIAPIEVGVNAWNKNTGEVVFTIPASLNIGQYYKIQLAYISLDGTIGYYSTVGVVKYTSEPKVSILDPTNGETYTGVYSQKAEDDSEIKDYNEKVYSYSFTLTDANGNIIETSGEKLHNSSFDVNLYESIDSYTIKTGLEKDKMYYLDYSIKTINGLIRTAQTKKIFRISSIDSKLHTELNCKLNYENGYIDISLVKPLDVEIEEPAVGSFYLLRASDEDNFNSWHEVLKFVLYGQQPSRHLWKDMTVKQGVKYKYAIQQFNVHGIKSNKIESNIIEADFEHAFLYDGERQLKIKYNPKVSSFKNTLLESKIDTIGSKHPFIFRNGNVNYKEFPISGLISYLSDENNLFYNIDQYFNEDELYRLRSISNTIIQVTDGPITEVFYNKYKDFYYYKENDKKYILWSEYIEKNYPKLNINNWDHMELVVNEVFRNKKLYQERDYGEIKVKTTNLTADNIFIERNFKLEVLEWLTNGKPKLFRSPVEGNYIVRLMNSSLTPSDQLGRTIHTFNCTAYEIAENNYDSLEKYNFIKVNNQTEPQLRWLSVDLAKNKIKNNTNLLQFTAESVILEGLLPGDKFEITTLEGRETRTYTAVIGATGKYAIDLSNNVQILSLSFKGTEMAESYHQGLLTYAYYSTEFKDSFDTINAIASDLVPCEQFIGAYENIIEEIENIKEKIDSIGFIRFTLRNDDAEVYYFNNNYYSDKEVTDIIDLTDLIDIYKVHHMDLILVNPKEQISLKEFNINKSMYWYNNQKFTGSYQEFLDLVKKQKIYILTSVDFEWFDGYHNISLGKECKDSYTRIIINDSMYNIDLQEVFLYELSLPQNITSIKTGEAIICDICYSKKVINYDLEETDSMKEAKKPYDNALKTLKTAISNSSTSRKDLKKYQDECKKTYKSYIQTLDLAIQEAERR